MPKELKKALEKYKDRIQSEVADRNKKVTKLVKFLADGRKAKTIDRAYVD